MIRVVADTNVFISALMFGGVPGSFLDLVFQGSFLLVTSPALLDELDEKLRLKFKVSPEDADVIRTRIQINALVVEPGIVLNIVGDDPDDNRVLEAAVAGEADYVVSGDRHLLKVGSVENIPILTTRQFMDIVEAVL
jgi:uncharacterized protein